MVERYQLVLGIIGILLMVAVPVVCVLGVDFLVERWKEFVVRRRDARAVRLEHRQNVHLLRHQTGIPLEQLVCDLRRLRRTLATDEHRSATHQLGNRLAYDRLLIQACTMVEIEHDLDGESGGMEREIERVRVEAALEGAGVRLSDRNFGQAA